MKKTIIKKIISAALFAAIAFQVSAFDFGGTIDDTTKFSGNAFNSLSLDQKNAATVWIRTPFNNEGTLYLAAEGTCQFQYVPATEDNMDDTKLLTADCNLFKFGGIFKLSPTKKILLSAGRFITTDSTSLIFTQTCDGILANIDLHRIAFSVYGGYTGLLNAQNITEINGSDSTYTFDATKIYAFAAPYAIGGFTVSAPYLFANQTLSAQFYGFFGVPGIDSADSTTGYNRMYGTLSLYGPLASSVFYTLTSTIGTDDMFSSLTNLSQLQLSWYPSFKASSISIKSIYASGNNGFLSPFKGFTSNPALVSISQQEYTGLLIAGLEASIKPVSQLYISAGADCVLGCPEEEISYSGFQYKATVRYQITTDLQITILANQFFGADNTSDDKTTLTAKAVFSF